MINTFVFMDLESTGLPLYGNRVRATEVSFVSVTRHNILNCHSEDCIPRIINKMSFVCNPRAKIPDDVVHLTGLSNENLENEPPFDQNKADLIKSFLKNCEPPTCLVAHNGCKFDFPLLKKELAAFCGTISADVLCADSIPAFKNVNKEDENSCDKFSPIIDQTDVMLFYETSRVEEYVLTQTENETTPMAQLLSEAKEATTPPSPSKSALQFQNVKRKLFDDNDRGEDTKSKLKVNYSLTHVYRSLFHRAITKAHSAESDTLALLQCCVKIGDPLLKYLDTEAQKFEDVIAMR